MLLPPLARACRPGLHAAFGPRPLRLTRVFTSSPLHRKDVHGQRPSSSPPSNSPLLEEGSITSATKSNAAPAPAAAAAAKRDTLLAEQSLSNKEQRKADWAIIREMSHYLWPKDNMGTRMRVGVSVALLVGAKLLNVQVPFYFKSIIDSMNIDFAALGGTAWTVAGSMIIACKLTVVRSELVV